MKGVPPILLIVAFVCVSCVQSPRWVEVESHTKQWNHLMTNDSPKTILLIKHKFYALYGTEGPFESKVYDEESLEILGENVNFRDPKSAYSACLRPSNQKATGSIVLDEINGRATINLQEEFKGVDGLTHLRRYPSNGTYDLKSWFVDEKRKR